MKETRPMTQAFDIAAVRAAFPALALTDAGQPRRYFDAPAGTQVAGRVMDAMRDAMLHACANDGGAFRTSLLHLNNLYLRLHLPAWAASANLLVFQKPRA